MKPEPLKNKLLTREEMIEAEFRRFTRAIVVPLTYKKFCLYWDIISAVLWLKKEIKKKKFPSAQNKWLFNKIDEAFADVKLIKFNPKK